MPYFLLFVVLLLIFLVFSKMAGHFNFTFSHIQTNVFSIVDQSVQVYEEQLTYSPTLNSINRRTRRYQAYCCFRCNQLFPSTLALSQHTRIHLVRGQINGNGQVPQANRTVRQLSTTDYQLRLLQSPLGEPVIRVCTSAEAASPEYWRNCGTSQLGGFEFSSPTGTRIPNLNRMSDSNSYRPGVSGNEQGPN